MTTDPMQFLQHEIPSLFNRGVAALRERAASGDERAAARIADLDPAHGAMRFVLDGADGGEVWLSVSGGEMISGPKAPDGAPVRMVVAAPADAARAGLEELDSLGVLDPEQASRWLTRTVSSETEKLLEQHRLEFHVTLTDLPTDPDEVTLRVGLGASEPPAEPKFSAKLSWDDVEDVRSGDLTPQQLFGRLRLSGDASQAMALGMTLLQRRR